MADAYTTLAQALSMIGGLGLVGVGAYLNVADLGKIEGYLSPYCLMMYGLAGGTALAAGFTPKIWAGRRVLACLIISGVLCGEAFGFYTTAERLLAARNERAGHVVDHNAPRLAAQAAVKRAVDDLASAVAETAKARSDRRCGDVCKAWEMAEEKARERLSKAEVSLLATAPVRDPNPLATALGVSAAVADIVPALLGSAALLILGFGLIAAAHDSAPRDLVEIGTPYRSRQEEAVARIREMTRQNGGVPPAFHVVKNELNLPAATAHRYRRKAMGD